MRAFIVDRSERLGCNSAGIKIKIALVLRVFTTRLHLKTNLSHSLRLLARNGY